MDDSPFLSWVESLDFLRSCVQVPAALSNATTLVAARGRWGQHVRCSTSMHDLLFTVPSAGHPFARSVRVHVDGARHTVVQSVDTDVQQFECASDNVDRRVDEALEKLTAPAQVCRACGTPSASQDFSTVFERMHYVCFHFEFEHRERDRDEPCGLNGCPAGDTAPS